MFSPDVIPTWFAILMSVVLIITFVVITAPERRRRRANKNWAALGVPERIRK